jgi:ACS family glucarate transporter-like MFS transporter
MIGPLPQVGAIQRQQETLVEQAQAIRAASAAKVQSRTRWMILAILFAVTTINYADRATISIAGPAIKKALGLDAVQMGFVFSAFAWSYVLAQLPGGWLLDRFGSKMTYFFSIFLWSIFTMLTGAAGFVAGGAAVILLFALRLLVGAAEAPSFPGNSRITSAWFPSHERGLAAAVFNSAQYFATVLFAPIMGWLVHSYGWQSVFYVMGGLGILMSLIWLKTIYAPKQHPSVSASELQYIQEGGALVYLVQERHMTILKAGFVASLPAIAGFLGGVIGGWLSDRLAKAGYSLSVSRKVPIVIGMLLSMSMIACNYIQTDMLVVAVMSLAFFGKGVGALGWAVVSDTSPKEAGGLSGALFNTFGNTAGITTPIVIGYIVQGTGSFDGALVFVGANAALAIACYLFIVGDIKRVSLTRSLIAK